MNFSRLFFIPTNVSGHRAAMLRFQHTKLRMVALRRKAARPPDDNHDGAVGVLCYCSKRVRCGAACGGVGLSISSNVARPAGTGRISRCGMASVSCCFKRSFFLSFFLHYSNVQSRDTLIERREVIAAAFLCRFSSAFKLVLVDRMIGLRWTFIMQLCADLCVSATVVHITKCDIQADVSAVEAVRLPNKDCHLSSTLAT